MPMQRPQKGKTKEKEQKQYHSLTFRVASDVALRTAQLNDQEHLIVPVVALVEGVLWPSNSEKPELALASEFGRFPESWDGRPILQGHPHNTDGEPVAANSPDLWDTSVMGQLFNTTLDGKKLKAEMWVNTEKAGEELIDRFNDEVVEVSTGLFAETENESGIFNGERYEGIWRNIVPDHLAILSAGTTGACSVADGCGAPRTNQGRMMATCPCPKSGAAKAEAGILNKAFKGLMSIFGIKTGTLSDTDIQQALYAALVVESKDRYCYIVAVFPTVFVYVEYSANYGEAKTYQRKYTVVEGGAVTLSKDVTEVRAETDYVPVSVSIQQSPNQQGDTMTQAEQDAKRVTDEAAALTKANTENAATAAALKTKASEAREYLKGVIENPKDLEGKSDIEVIGLAATAKALTAGKKAAEAATAAAAAGTKANATAQEYIAAAPVELRPGLEKATAYYNERKEALIKALTGKSDLSEIELRAMEPSVLEKMSKMAGIPEATVYGQPAHLSAVKGEQFTPPQEAFPRKAA